MGEVKGRYYIAAFPFFIRSNTVAYNLIHCTGHYKGFELFKTTAWKTFGDKSSMKNTHNNENQMSELNWKRWDCIFCSIGWVLLQLERCSFVCATTCFEGKKMFQWWSMDYLGEHPVFPTRDYKNKIKDVLKKDFGMKASRSSMTFSDRSY